MERASERETAPRRIRSAGPGSLYQGVLVVDKASGPTSHDVVSGLRRMLGMRRIGHCGTLDPLATGVLVLCLGEYTRLSQWLSAGTKEYRAALLLGVESDTFDTQGKLVHRSGVRAPSREEVEGALEEFEGWIDQVPPPFSAVKIKGVRSYERARRGEKVELDARRVRIEELELLSYDFPRLEIRLRCSRGTYVRSLASDLGRRLGCGGVVSELRRLRVGSMGLEAAHTLEEIEHFHLDGSLQDHFVPLREALGLPEIRLGARELRSFLHGNAVPLPKAPGRPSGECAVYDGEGSFLGIGVREGGGLLKPRKVFRREPAGVSAHGR